MQFFTTGRTALSGNQPKGELIEMSHVSDLDAAESELNYIGLSLGFSVVGVIEGGNQNAYL